MFKPSASGGISVLTASQLGAKNYLSTYNGNTGNGDLETGATTGFSLGTVTLTNALPTGVPTFGSGASGNLSLAVVSSGQLAGSYSLSYASSAATTAGNFVATSAFTIDTEDQAKVLTFKIYYQAQSGTANCNFSGTSSNSFGVAIYDTTNASWIIPAGAFSLTQGSGYGYATGTFQTASNSTSYRLVLYNANATSGAATLYLDDFSVSPQTAPYGPVITDWVAYTPTCVGLGTPVVNGCYYRREGADVFVRGLLTTGTVTGSTVQIGLPSGYTAASTISSNEMAGIWGRGTNVAQSFYVIRQPSVTYVNLAIESSTAGFTSQTPIIGTAINTSETISFNFSVPCAGLSSNVQMSNDTDTRVVAAKATVTSTVTPSANGIIIAGTTVFDTHGSYNSSTGIYTVPVSGYYRVSASFQSSASTSNCFANYNSGSITTYIGYANGTGVVTSGSALFKCVAGDTLSVNSGSSVTFNSITTVEFERLSGPSVIAATETVAMNYELTANQSVSNGGSSTIIWNNKILDTHLIMNTATGTATIPVSGTFFITTNLNFSTSGSVTLGNLTAAIQKSGSTIRTSGATGDSTSASTVSPSTSYIGRFNAGDTITVQGTNSGNGAALNVVGGSGQSSFNLIRIGL